VHFFKNLRSLLISSGNHVIITASRKDIAFELLQEMNMPFTSVGSYGKSIFQKFLNIPLMVIKMIAIALREKPDIMLGLGSSRITQAGFILSIPTYVFTDTEHAKFQIALYRPFASKIITPDSFELNFGSKHLRYSGFHDLAYLHPEVFVPDSSVLSKYQIDPNKPFFTVRFIAWEASHDVGQKGLSKEGKRTILKELEKYGQILLFIEGVAEEEFNKYIMKINGSDIHHIMAFAKMHIGEGGTMASESSVLGVPTILINSLSAGVIDSLEKKYKLIYRSMNIEVIISKIREWMSNKNLRNEYLIKRERILSENINPNPLFYKWIKNQK